MAGFAPKPNFSRGTSQPTVQIFGRCNLLDFAALRKRSWRLCPQRSWSSRSNLRSGTAECAARSCVAVAEQRSWRRGAECRTFFGVAGFAPKP
ncbi:MAG: hypothetical protein WA977_08785 [Halobacteriota archaeon]